VGDLPTPRKTLRNLVRQRAHQIRGSKEPQLRASFLPNEDFQTRPIRRDLYVEMLEMRCWKTSWMSVQGE
jgi:hypothetical protein